MALESGTPLVRLYLDSAWLRLHQGSVYPQTFFESTTPPLLAVQKAYHRAVQHGAGAPPGSGQIYIMITSGYSGKSRDAGA